MRHTDAESGMKALVEASPDTAMQIIAKRQPFLAKRIQDEPDPEKAKQLMLQAEDMWDALIEMLAETSGKDIKKIKKLMMLYDRKRWKKRRRKIILITTMGLFVPVAGMYWLFTGLSDLFRYEEPKEQRVAGKSWKRIGGVPGLGSVNNFVLIDAAKVAERVVYDDAINGICRPRTRCAIWFWSDETKMPSKNVQSVWDVTDDQINSKVADYIINPHTNYERFLWSCRIVNDPDQCFTP